MPTRMFRAIAAFAIGCWVMTGVALADGKVALVIGNSSYQKIPLANPTNDAKLVAGALGEAGFEVQLVTDLTRAGMVRALRDFSEAVARKGKDTVALVYYAGHGVQIDGENFLVPVDAKVERESDVAIETMRLADMMTALAALPTSLRIVILDACRNNPFDVLSKGGKGLAIVDAPTGSIVAYSTAPGSEALDGGSAGNSPYTAALVEVMRQPNLQIEQMFKSVRVKVNALTGGKQVPWETSSLTVNFAFFGKAPGAPLVAAAPAAPATEGEQPATPVAVASTDFSAVAKARIASIKTLPAERAYDVVIEENSVEAYEEFIRIYPEDPRCRQIKILLLRRNQIVAWRNAIVSNTPEAYAAYEDLYPESDFAYSARRLRIQPRLRPIDTVIVRPIHLPISKILKIGGSVGSLGVLNAGSRPILGGPGRITSVGTPGGVKINIPGTGTPKVGTIGTGTPKVGTIGTGTPKIGTTGTGTPKITTTVTTPKITTTVATPKITTTVTTPKITTVTTPKKIVTTPKITTFTTPKLTTFSAPRVLSAPSTPRFSAPSGGARFGGGGGGGGGGGRRR